MLPPRYALLGLLVFSPIGCSSDTSEALPLDAPKKEIVESNFRPMDLEVVNIDGSTGSKVRINQPFEVRGTFRTTGVGRDRSFINVKIMKVMRDGRRVVAAESSTKPERTGENEFQFRAEITAPKRTGDYVLVMRSGAEVIDEQPIRIVSD